MNRGDALKVLAVLRAAYPKFYSDIDRGGLESIATLWEEMFADEPYALVAGAVKRLIASDTKGFPPVIGQVKEHIYKLTHSEAATEQEAWGCVAKAIRRGIYNSDAEYAALPDDVKRLVTAQDIHQWAVDEHLNTEVVASNFMRSYRARAAENKEQAKLPKELNLAIGSAVKQLT